MKVNLSDRDPIEVPDVEVMQGSALGPKISAALGVELGQAMAKFKPFSSAHEGYAIILEELDELWEEVRKQYDQRSKAKMKKEALQVCAMAFRFMHDICPEEFK
jgi:hypothetical protein